MLNSEYLFKARIVQIILMKESFEAIKALSHHYGVDIPHLKVGMPKRHSKKVGCYVSKTKTIHVLNQEYLDNPFVILHEFYHHLRTQDGEHRGTEKYANRFAEEFIEVFKTLQEMS
jgi:Zn-dependent peptidase ImmA (M78 family)